VHQRGEIRTKTTQQKRGQQENRTARTNRVTGGLKFEMRRLYVEFDSGFSGLFSQARWREKETQDENLHLHLLSLSHNLKSLRARFPINESVIYLVMDKK
jgi:hypothetical protein